jgi:molybdopterin molybdotransferase
MDGFAVSGPGPWRIVGTVSAGDNQRTILEQGTCVRIGTGAQVPEGADRVLPWEDVDIDSADGTPTIGAHVIFLGAAHKTHIRPQGEERHQGDVIAHSGTELDPILIGHLASAGIDAVSVRVKPRVRIIVFGDEVITSGVPQVGQVRDALGIQLPMWFGRLGAEVTSVEYCGDDDERVMNALSVTGEILVTTGGTSRGHRDFVRQAWLDVGGEWIIDGVHVRPGHPMMLGRRAGDGGVLVALPGNPLSAVVALMTLAVPLLDSALGRVPRPLGEVRMQEQVATEVTRLMLGSRDAGDFVGTTHASSAMLAGASRSEGWAIVEPPGTDADCVVPWLCLPWRV